MTKKLKLCSSCEAIEIDSSADLWLNKEADKRLYDSFKENYPLKESICPPCKEADKRAKDFFLIYQKPNV